MEYNRDLCIREHKSLDEKLDNHNKRLNNYSGRIKDLENYQSRAEEIMKNLCEQIKNLVKAIYWFIGVVILGLGGFFIWYVQSL